jgi:hypothetical protein
VQHELAIKRHPVLDDGGLELAVGYDLGAKIAVRAVAAAGGSV